ncbi:MAG: VWA domain-containing protein [archaeon]
MEIIFDHPYYLWLFIAVPLIILTHFFMLRHLRTRAWVFANFEAIKKVTGASPAIHNSFVLSKNYVLLLFKIAILTAMILSVAGPTLWYFGRTTANNYVLALDSSSSMLADDFDPNRFIAAKKAAIGFLDSISTRTKVGLVTFAGTSFAEHQLTGDVPAVKSVIAKLQIKKVGGTDLGEALVTATNMLLNEEKARSIILLTDGRDTVGTPLEEGILYAKDNKVIVHTIGVATEEGGKFLRIEALSKIDSEALEMISSSTGGSYFLAEDDETLAEAYAFIAESSEEKLSLRFQFPLMLLALALIFIEWGLVNTRYRTLP